MAENRFNQGFSGRPGISPEAEKIFQCLGLAAMLFVIFLSPGCGRQAKAPMGRIILLEGPGAAAYPDSRSGRRAGDLLYRGDSVDTAGNSTCDIQGKDFLVRLDSASELSFPSPSFGSGADLRLDSGRMFVRSGRGSSSGVLSVLLPGARAELADAEAVLEVNTRNIVRLTVGRGTVSITALPGGEPVVGREGEKVQVESGKASKKQFTVRDRSGLEEFAEMRGATEPMFPDAGEVFRVSSIPEGADILMNGSFIGRSPLELTVRGRKRIWFKASLSGYEEGITNVLPARPRKDGMSLVMTLASATQEQHPLLVENDSVSAEPGFTEGGIYLVQNAAILRYFERERNGRYETKASFETGGRINGPLLRKGLLLVGSSDGYYYGLTPDLKVAWKKNMGDSGFSLPGLDADGMFLGTASGYFFSLNPDDGYVNWQFRTLSPVYSSVAVADETICFASSDKALYGLDRALGTFLWRVSMERPVNRVTPLFDGERFIVLDSAGCFYCVDQKGRIIYWRSTRDRYVRAFYAGEEGIFSGSGSGRVQGFDRQSGRMMWQTDLKAAVTSDFILVRGDLYAGLSDGRVIKIDPATGKTGTVARLKGRVKFVSHFDRSFYATTTAGIYKL